MSQIAQFRAAEMALAQQVRAFEELRNSPALQKELAFNTDLEDLLAKHNMNKTKLVTFLQEEAAPLGAAFEKKPSAKTAKADKPTKPATDKAPKKPRNASGIKGGQPGPRALKRYTNPHTNEIVDTARRDHKVVKAWIAEHTQEVVDSWAVPL